MPLAYRLRLIGTAKAKGPVDLHANFQSFAKRSQLTPHQLDWLNDRGADPAKRFDDLLRTSQTEYFDIMLLHYQHTGNWIEESERWRDMACLVANILNVAPGEV